MRWWRLFRSKFGKGAAGSQESGLRRREAERFDYPIAIRIQIEGWADAETTTTLDVSRTGLFAATERPAKPGQRAAVEIDLGGGALLRIAGRVARRADAPGSGVGMAFDEPDDKQRALLERLLEAARAAAPRPEEAPSDDPAQLVDDSELDLLDLEPEETSELLVLDDLPPRAGSKAEPLPESAPPATPPRPANGGVVVGIDLGTTYTSVAAIVGSKVVILPRDDGRKSTPSVLSFPDRETVLVGDRERVTTDPGHTIISPKRILGRPFAEPEVERFLGQAPYRALEGPDGSVIIEMWGETYAVPQLISHLLADAREVAESHLGTKVEQAVVSVPISFDSERIEALRRAGRMAGLDIIAVIDEPSAAALANRFEPHFGGVVGVYDFGGGTFDFSVVDVSHGDFRVLATSGDTWLGGDDFDHVLATAAANQFWRKHQVDLRNQALEWQRLLFACERAKRQLTTAERAAISVPEVLRTADGMVDLSFTIDRGILERASAGILQQSLETCDEALALVDMQPTDLSAIYLSGGTTYIPCVRTALSAHFGIPIRTGVPPEHAVCLGAAIHAAQLQLRSAATLATRD